MARYTNVLTSLAHNAVGKRRIQDVSPSVTPAGGISALTWQPTNYRYVATNAAGGTVNGTSAQIFGEQLILSGSSGGGLKLYEGTSNGVHSLTVKAPDAVTADKTLTLPDGPPATSGYALVSTDAGIMSWSEFSGANFYADALTYVAGTTQQLTIGMQGTADIVMTGDLRDFGQSIKLSGTNAGSIDLHEAGGSELVRIQAPATVTGIGQIYTLPDAYPASNGYALVSSTAGAMSWAPNSSANYYVTGGTYDAGNDEIDFTGVTGFPAFSVDTSAFAKGSLAGAANYVGYFTATNALTGTAGFQYDGTNISSVDADFTMSSATTLKPELTLTSTSGVNATNQGGYISFYRNDSTNPYTSTADVLGTIQFQNRNLASVKQSWADIKVIADDVTINNEISSIRFRTRKPATTTLQDTMTIYRDRVGIKTNTPAYQLDVVGTTQLSGNSSIVGTLTTTGVATLGNNSVTNTQTAGNNTTRIATTAFVAAAVAANSGTPAGSSTQLQYNNGGAFGGVDDWTWNGTDMTIATGSKLIFGDANRYIDEDGANLRIRNSETGGNIDLNAKNLFRFYIDGAQKMSLSSAGTLTVSGNTTLQNPLIIETGSATKFNFKPDDQAEELLITGTKKTTAATEYAYYPRIVLDSDEDADALSQPGYPSVFFTKFGPTSIANPAGDPVGWRIAASGSAGIASAPQSLVWDYSSNQSTYSNKLILSEAGVLTATTFSGELAGTIASTTTATTQSAGNSTTKVATTAFVASAISGGGLGTVTSVAVAGNNGISVSGSPITSNGTITLGLSNLANSVLANSTVSYGGVSLALGATDATPAFDLTDATNYEGAAIKSTGEAGGSKFLREDGDGTSSWQAIPASSPGGSTTQMQYNNAGSFGGTDNLYWIDASDRLFLSGSTAELRVGAQGTSAGINFGNHSDRIFTDNYTMYIQNNNSMIFNIDSNNNHTGQKYEWRHNAEGAGGTALMTLGDDGNLGIGTTSPGGKVEIATSSETRALYINNAKHGVYSTSTTAGYWGGVFFNSNGGTEVDIAGSTYAGIFTGGNVGIGATAPAHKLSILDGTVGGFINPRSSTATVSMGAYTAHPLQIYAGGNEAIRVKSDGNVGIGTTSPSNALSVWKAINNDFVAELKNTHATAGQSWGLQVCAGTNSSDAALAVENEAEDTSLFYVRGDGNVGIGTSSPLKKLDVRGNNSTWALAALSGSSEYGTGLQLYNSHTTVQDWAIIGGGASKNYTFRIYDQTDAKYRLAIDRDGKVGIGGSNDVIISPSAYLDVAASDLTALFGSDEGTNGALTNSTQKTARIGMPHYTNAEEPVGLIVGVSNATQNILQYGGGSSSFNAASVHKFYTSDGGFNTTNGTVRASIQGDANYSKLFLGADSTLGFYRYGNRMDFYVDSQPRIQLDTGTLFASNATGAPSIDLFPSAGTATYGFYGDTDTGLDRTGADTLVLLTAGTARMTISSAGNATFTEAVTLGDNSVTNTQTAGNSTTRIATTAFVASAVAAGGNGDVSKVGTPVDNQLAVWTGANTIEGNANFTYNGTIVDINGNLRVQDSHTLAAGDNDDLFLYHDGNSTIRSDSGIFNINQNTASDMSINANGGDIVIDSNIYNKNDGKVGIGTSGPDAKVEILSTTEQLRLTHTAASKYMSTAVDSNGSTIWTNQKSFRLSGAPATGLLQIDQNKIALVRDATSAASNMIQLGDGATYDQFSIAEDQRGSTATNGFLKLRAKKSGTAGYRKLSLNAVSGSHLAELMVDSISTNEALRFDTETKSHALDIAKAGYVSIGASVTTTDALYVNGNTTINGVLSATAKSFNIPHPLYKDKRLVHGSLEGPEHAIYIRGTIETEEKGCLVELPEYWSAMCEDYTVQLTPHGPYTVYIKEKLKDKVMIECSEENYKFDYYIVGARTDETIEVVQDG